MGLCCSLGGGWGRGGGTASPSFGGTCGAFDLPGLLSLGQGVQQQVEDLVSSGGCRLSVISTSSYRTTKKPRISPMLAKMLA